MFYLKGCVLSESLPHELKMVRVSSAGSPRYGVYCGQLRIKKGMRFGPYTGSIVCPEKMATSSVQREFLWEVKYLRLLSRLFITRPAVLLEEGRPNTREQRKSSLSFNETTLAPLTKIARVMLAFPP